MPWLSKVADGSRIFASCEVRHATQGSKHDCSETLRWRYLHGSMSFHGTEDKAHSWKRCTIGLSPGTCQGRRRIQVACVL